jgi:hypothetical protein
MKDTVKDLTSVLNLMVEVLRDDESNEENDDEVES